MRRKKGEEGRRKRKKRKRKRRKKRRGRGAEREYFISFDQNFHTELILLYIGFTPRIRIVLR